MAVELSFLSAFLSPSKRGAPDRLATVVESLADRAGRLSIASQQVSNRRFVETMVAAAHGKTRVLVEGRFLEEQEDLPLPHIWQPGGRFEENRQCMAALLRSGAAVRSDYVASALMHSNFVVSRGEATEFALLSSANFSPGSIDSHYNWAATTQRSEIIEVLQTVFDASWDGDFRGASSACSFMENGCKLDFKIGAHGEALSLLEAAVRASTASIDFAFFNFSNSSSLLEAMLDAHKRGVRVHGLVDGDQSLQPWDAVPHLQEVGLDVRYYPGAMTGGVGRMHYKFASIDGSAAYLGTANLSKSALSSLEFALLIQGHTGLAHLLTQERRRLWPLAKRRALTKTRF